MGKIWRQTEGMTWECSLVSDTQTFDFPSVKTERSVENRSILALVFHYLVIMILIDAALFQLYIN